MQLRLFCFPYAGGSAQIFRTWSNDLPPAIEVCPVELPGRGTRLDEAPHTRLLTLVKAIAEGISPYLDRPFAFFGHSMGALISAELARLLRRRLQLVPAHLFMAGQHAFQLKDPYPALHTLPEPHLIQELQRLNGTPMAVLENPDLMELFLPTLRADLAVCETYTYDAGPPFDCPITVFGGLQDGVIERRHLEAWQDQTNASFSVRMLPGDHFFLHTSQPLLLRILSDELKQYAVAVTG